MLKIKKIDHIFRPVFFCDVCDGEIKNTGLAIVLFHPGAEDDAMTEIVHKGKCHDEAEGKFLEIYNGYPAWTELDELISDMKRKHHENN